MKIIRITLIAAKGVHARVIGTILRAKGPESVSYNSETSAGSKNAGKHNTRLPNSQRSAKFCALASVPKCQAEIIKNNIGLRLQSKLTKEQAKFVAACNSVHKDISLNF